MPQPSQTWPPYVVLTDAATIVWDLGQVWVSTATVVLGGNRTLSVLHPVVGSYTLIIQQDSTGSRSLTLGGTNWRVIDGGSGAISLTTAPGAIDILAFTFDGANFYATLGPNYT